MQAVTEKLIDRSADSTGRCNTRGQLVISNSRRRSPSVSQFSVLRGLPLSSWATCSRSGPWTFQIGAIGEVLAQQPRWCSRWIRVAR